MCVCVGVDQQRSATSLFDLPNAERKNPSEKETRKQQREVSRLVLSV